MAKFKIGDRVKVKPSNDNENYKKFKNRILIITHVATDTMGHPGFDSSMKGEGLYDFELQDGTEVPWSLYDYELVRATGLS